MFKKYLAQCWVSDPDGKLSPVVLRLRPYCLVIKF